MKVDLSSLDKSADRALKRQRRGASTLDELLDEALRQVDSTEAELLAKKEELERQKNASTLESEKRESKSEEEDAEIEHIIGDFVKRVQALDLKRHMSDEFTAVHATLSKFGNQIKKTLPDDVAQMCDPDAFDAKLIYRLIAEYLYHDGQIEAGDSLCQEANVEVPPNYRTCFLTLRKLLSAFKDKDLQPAITWTKENRERLNVLELDIDFRLRKLQFLEYLQACNTQQDAVQFAKDILHPLFSSYPKQIRRLLACIVYKDKLQASPYQDLCEEDQWEYVEKMLRQACCRIHNVPAKPYLRTCLSAGITALPAMRKMIEIMSGKLEDLKTMEELPVELPMKDEHRFHSVIACPVSKDECTPDNPPMLLRCGHAICRDCVDKISHNRTRRFKCPYCPTEQSANETRELMF